MNTDIPSGFIELNSLPKIEILKFSSKRYFGLELEFGNHLSGNRLAAVIGQVDGNREVRISQRYEQDTDNNFWHVKLDHSCGDIKGDYGWELASFKASGIKDIGLMGDVTESIRKAGANVNNRCALHVHVEINDFSQAQLAVMCALWIKIEPFVCHLIPPHRADHIYCKFLRHEKWVGELIKSKEKLTPEIIWGFVKPQKNDNTGRRKSMNICNYIFTDRKTVEFRFPESTLCDYDVKNWLKFFISFVEMSKQASIPENLMPCDFTGFLSSLGLYGRNPFLVLSSGLKDTKIWVLNRAVKFSRSQEIIFRAKEHLDLISRLKEPLEEKVGT